MAVKIPIILSIAGFDPSSGAGVTADIKTCAAHGCYGLGAITALTVQSTQRVGQIEPVSGRFLRATLDELASDCDISAVRIGMLATDEAATVTADFLDRIQPKWVVLDPIIRSSSGAVLTGEAGIAVLKRRLIPLATVITPNIQEAEELSGAKGPAAGAHKLREMGARNTVVTGGHLPDNTDFLLTESGGEDRIPGAKVNSSSTHGTGCAFSTAIACNLALGKSLPDAVREAKEYVRKAIEAAYPIGKGKGPLNHFFRL